MKSDRVKVGDMIGCDGHIALIVGLDERNIYIAEAYKNGIVIEKYERYEGIAACGDYVYVMLMDEVYAEHGGEGNITDMWVDYSESGAISAQDEHFSNPHIKYGT